MTSHDHERKEIIAAAQRLLEGKPLRSNGSLTVVTLAEEAGLKRWRLTHEHTDLMRGFQAQVKAAHGDPPQVTALKRKLVTAEEDLAKSRKECARLRARTEKYAQAIDNLARALEGVSEGTAHTVTPLRR